MFKQHQNLVIIVSVAIIVTFAFWYKGAIAPDVATLSTGENNATTTSEQGSNSNEGVTSNSAVTPTAGTVVKTPTTSVSGKKFKEFVRPTGYLNTRQLNILGSDVFTLGQYIGQKVIVLQFLTTSDLASMRDAQYLDYLYKKYDDSGLLVVGVHAPQFIYERNKDAVQKALDRYGATYPAIMDNEFTTWAAYKNAGWPTTYVIDIYGNIVSTKVGEGDYGTLENKVKTLLTERATKLKLAKPVLPANGSPENMTFVDSRQLKSADTYFGSKKNRTLANGTALKEGVQDLKIPGTISLNMLYLSGSWSFAPETASNLTPNTGITYRYSAKNVHILSGAPSGLVRVDVLRDGKALTPSESGKDIRIENGASYFYVKENKFYDIIADQAGYGEHTLELSIKNGNIAAYLLTFE